jgi:SAM-dependent methyltransferase
MIRKIAYKIVKVMYKAMISLVFFVQKSLSVTHNHQSDFQKNPTLKKNKPGRDTNDRYDAILSNIDEHPKSLIDLGCNKGIFVLKAATENSFSVGVDHDWFEIIWAEATAKKNNINNAIFMNAEINLSFVEKLPKFDMIVCTSIFHHWVRIYGKNEAFKMMRIIASKTNSYLVFETGQHNEISTRWYDKLDFMGNDSEKWIKDFLSEIGFSEIRVAGEFSTLLSDVKRTLFVAKK